MAILEVNYVAVLVATIASFAFGALWYGALFSKAWLKAIGKSEEDLKRSVTPMVVTFVAQLVMATMLYGILVHVGIGGIRAGIMSGVMIWAGFVLTSMIINHAFQGAKPMLTLIDGGHFLGVLIIMGGILGAFGV